MKKWIALLLALALSAVLLGCEEAESFAGPEDAMAALNGQGTLTMHGDFESINQSSDLYVGGISAAHMEESGLFNIKWAVTIKGQDWFYVKYVTGEPVNNQEGINSGVTLGFYDSNDTCLGYAQEQIVGDYGYLWIMLNPDFSPTGLWATEKGDALYDEADNLLATGKTNFSYSSNLCDFTIDCVGGQDVPVFAKFAMYMELYSQAKTLHG